MSYSYIPNHADQAASRVSEEYKDATLVVATMRAAVQALQQLEDAIGILYQTNIGNAANSELDIIGRIVGQPRNNMGDSQYRLWVMARMLANRSSGTAEELIAIAYIVTRGTVPILLSEFYPAAVVIQIGATSMVNPSDLQAILQDARAGGVELDVTSDMSNDPLSFAFDPNGAGFGDPNNTATGGRLAGASDGTSVTPAPPPAPPTIASFLATPSTVALGATVTLSWSVTNASALYIDNGVGNVSGSAVSVTPSTVGSHTYTLTATNAGGSVTATVTVTVTTGVAPPSPPSISSFTATPSTLTIGASITFAWSVTGATSLYIDNGVGAVTGTSATFTPSATGTFTYTLTATNAGGTVTATATVTVNPLPSSGGNQTINPFVMPSAF